MRRHDLNVWADTQKKNGTALPEELYTDRSAESPRKQSHYINQSIRIPSEKAWPSVKYWILKRQQMPLWQQFHSSHLCD